MAETMYTYINEQPVVLKAMLQTSQTAWTGFAQLLQSHCLDKLIFTASGTSYHAAAAAKHFLENILDMEVEVVYPFSFIHYENRLSPHSMVIGISQGGGSTATINALRKAEAKGCLTAALTANEHGQIVKAARHTILIPCGEEKVVFRTKGYTSTLFALYMMALEAALVTGKINNQLYTSYLADLEQLIAGMSSIVSLSDHWYGRNQQQLQQAKKIIVVGYGPNFATALEGGLKLNETVRCPVNAYELEEFMHGPHLSLDQSSYVFLIASQGAGQERILALYDYLQQVTPYTYLIVNEERECFRPEKDLNIFSDSSEVFSPLEFVIPFQILSYRLSADKEIDLTVPKYPDFHQRLKTKIK